MTRVRPVPPGLRDGLGGRDGLDRLDAGTAWTVGRLRNIFSIRPVTTYPPTTLAAANAAATNAIT